MTDQVNQENQEQRSNPSGHVREHLVSESFLTGSYVTQGSGPGSEVSGGLSEVLVGPQVGNLSDQSCFCSFLVFLYHGWSQELKYFPQISSDVSGLCFHSPATLPSFFNLHLKPLLYILWQFLMFYFMFVNEQAAAVPNRHQQMEAEQQESLAHIWNWTICNQITTSDC